MLFFENNNVTDFISPLLKWYFFNKREFPWRTNSVLNHNQWVYHTWICEVMSQQTLISVVVPKFNQFIKELPSITHLANCPEDLLRYLWSGLGYYARARNLQNGAKYILENYQDKFPSNKLEWLKVPGCGDYTSSIISSICFSEIVPSIDGNMIRVVSRLLELNENVWEKSGLKKIEKFISNEMTNYFSNSQESKFLKPGDFNQSFMDLGSLICKKQNPICHECPIQQSCKSFQNKTVSQCPPTKPRQNSKAESLVALALKDSKTNSYLIVERNSGFLQKTYGFPLFAEKNEHTLNSLLKLTQKQNLKLTTHESTFKHQITHHKITGQVAIIETELNSESTYNFIKTLNLSPNQNWIPLKLLKKQLSSSLDQKVLKILI